MPRRARLVSGGGEVDATDLGQCLYKDVQVSLKRLVFLGALAASSPMTDADCTPQLECDLADLDNVTYAAERESDVHGEKRWMS